MPDEWCMVMKDGKRLHRIAVSVDDELLMMLSHLANYDGRVLADYAHKVLQEHVFGSRIRLPKPAADSASGN